MLEKFCCYIYYTYICIDFYWFRYHIFLLRVVINVLTDVKRQKRIKTRICR